MTFIKVVFEPYVEQYALLGFASVVPLVLTLVFLGIAIARILRRAADPLNWRTYRGVIISATVFVVFQIPSKVAQADVIGRPLDEEQRYESPDGSAYAMAKLYLTYPRTEFIDPRVMLEVRLFDSRSGEEIGRARAAVSEHSDFMWPLVAWTQSTVVFSVFDFDQRDRKIIVTRKNKRTDNGGSFESP